MLVHENAVAWIYYYPEFGILELEWIALARGARFRDTLLDALQIARECGAGHWLNNALQLPPLSAPELVWCRDAVQPALAALPLRRLAGVAAAPAGRAYLTAIESHPAVRPHTRQFTERPAAWEWLTGE